MAKSIDEHKRVLTFETNEVFDAVIAFLETSAEAEVDRAISYSIDGEKRIHACGRAESLKDFKDLLLTLQKEAREGKYGS
jgi:hypothetical protein